MRFFFQAQVSDNGKRSTKLRTKLVRSSTNLVFAAVITLALAIGLLIGICVASIKSVDYQTLLDKLPEIQERTHTTVVASTTRSLDLAELPLAYRVAYSIRSLPIFSRNPPVGSGRWTETWEIQADGKTLNVSLLVLRDRVCMVVLKSAPKLEATGRWSATLAHLFPGIPQRRVAV